MRDRERWPSIGSASSGLVPQVTNGAIVVASIDTSRSNCAPGSDFNSVQSSIAWSSISPFGANSRPLRYSNVVASGATMPQRPPASIAMLHRVMRPSIESAPTAEPANSMAWPAAPSAPILAMIASARSLAPRPSASLPTAVMRMRLGFFCQSVCVISTWATSEAPMPNANAPKAPWVEVWLSPQTISRPGSVRPNSGPTTCTMPWRRSLSPNKVMCLIGGILVQLADHARDFGIGNRLATAARRHIMIGDAERQFRLRHRGAALGQAAESVERAFMHIVAIDPKQRLAVALHDLVPGPELVEQCQWRGHAAISGSRALRWERYIVC